MVVSGQLWPLKVVMDVRRSLLDTSPILQLARIKKNEYINFSSIMGVSLLLIYTFILELKFHELSSGSHGLKKKV